MSTEREATGSQTHAGAQFTTTHWSVVLAAGHESSPDARAALEQLSRTYWYPLYAYARRRGQNADDAADLVQSFFARVIEKQVLRGLDRESGRFRSFLLTCFNRFLSDARDHALRLKRGGGQEVISLDAAMAEERYHLEPADLLDPVKIFERRWALTVLDRVLERLKADLEAQKKSELFEHLQALVVGERGQTKQAELATRLGMTEGAVSVAVHRLRQRYRRLLRAEIAQTVACDRDVEEEIQHLLAILRS